MECMNDCTLSIQYKRLVTVVYIDFSKAFDVVSHNKLLIRLNTYSNSNRNSRSEEITSRAMVLLGCF